jgi:hypothetical protein
MLRIAAITLCGLSLAGAALAADVARPPAKEPPVDMRWDVKIPMRDGVRLSATLYEPQGRKERLPVVFTLTPYVAARYHDRGVYFARNGFVFLSVDVRGRGNSGGVFQSHFDDARDAYDIVEWLGQQPFATGKVAMWGGSYAGENQWAAARAFPPHLATIVPAAAAQAGVDFPMRGNVGSPYAMQWLTLVSGVAFNGGLFEDRAFWVDKYREQFRGERPFAQFDEVVGNPSPAFREWIAHPQQDPYWDARSPSPADYARLDLPILTLTGHYDGDQPGALAYYRDHMRHGSRAGKRKHYLVIGPWDHAGTRTPQAEFGGLKFGPASLVDLNKLHKEWYGWTMSKGPRPEFLKKRVAYYVTGPNERWRYAETLEGVTRERRTLYLDSWSGRANDVFASGSLSPQAAASATPDQYVYDPRDTSAAELVSAETVDSLVNQVPMLLNGGRGLVYHSAPFAQDTEVTGFFGLSAWLELDRPDTDFRVTVFEIKADGSAIWLADDVLRARYRESLREARLVPPGQALRYDFERFTFISRVVARGSRLRLTIGPTDSPYFEKNFQSGGVVAQETVKDAQTIRVKLYHDAQHPSALYVPIGQP